MNEKEYLNLVASLGCMECGRPAEIHHIRAFSGMGQRASDYLVIPLCDVHHRTGKDAIHNRTMNEGKYLAATIKAVAKRIKGE